MYNFSSGGFMKRFFNLLLIIFLSAVLTSGCLKKEEIKESVTKFIPLKTQQETEREAEIKDEIAQAKADISLKKLDKLSVKNEKSRKDSFEAMSYKNDFKEAESAYKAKNYTDAILGFNQVLKDNPKNYKAHCMLAMSYAQKGDNNSAEMVLTRAIEMFPDEWNAYTILGDIKRSEHNYGVAIEYYKKAIATPTIPDEAAKAFPTPHAPENAPRKRPPNYASTGCGQNCSQAKGTPASCSANGGTAQKTPNGHNPFGIQNDRPAASHDIPLIRNASPTTASSNPSP